jgi:hypothetical protein
MGYHDNYSLDTCSSVCLTEQMTTISPAAHNLAQLADPEVGPLDGLIDLDRYPLDQPGSPAWKKLVLDVRGQLDENGSACLAGFLTSEALGNAATEVAAIARHVPIREHSGSVYARTDLEAELDAGDPRRARLAWNAGHVTRDMFPPYSPAHRLYVSACFKAFIASVVGQERVFEYADPLAGLVATVLPPEGQYPWHYDTNEYVVTIMTQQPESGGVFEYHRDLRSPGDENLGGLGSVLAGEPDAPARSLDIVPGDLQLFLGRYSLHQVTKVIGDVDRHVLVLSYAERPGVIGPVDRTRSVYGRITEAHLLAEQTRLADNDGLIL